MKYVFLALLFFTHGLSQASFLQQRDEPAELFASRAVNALVKELNEGDKRTTLTASGSIVFPNITLQHTRQCPSSYSVTLDPKTGETEALFRLICDQARSLSVADITSERTVFGHSNLSYIRVSDENDNGRFVLVFKKKR